MTANIPGGVEESPSISAGEPDTGKPVRGSGARRWTGRISRVRRRVTLEHLLALVLGLLVLVVHDVGYMFSHPYWTDESWVAATTVFPLSQLWATTSTTPIGWSLLVRVFTISGTESARVVPLAFAGIAVVTAYWFGRKLGWQRREVAIGAGVLAAIAMVLVPAMLVRDDLKQYSSDACFAMLALACVSRLERNWSRSALILLSVVTWGGMLFSHVVAFAGAAAFAAVCLVQLARRAWRPLAEAVVAGVITAVLMAAVYTVFDSRAKINNLVESPHFRFYYVPVNEGLHSALSFLYGHFRDVNSQFGLGPEWLVVLLYVAGLVTLFRVDRRITAVMAAVLWPEMVVISALKLYPFMDPRTSTGLYAVSAVVAAIGVAGICALLRSYLKGALALGLAAAAVAGFVVVAHPDIRSHLIADEDVRDQVSYVEAHADSSDVILVNLNSSFNVAYYWKRDRPAREASTVLDQLYEPYYPSQPRIVMAADRDRLQVDNALAKALAESRQRDCAPIWFIASHVISSEAAYWSAALQRDHLTATPVGDDGLSVIHPGKSACA